LLSKRLVTVLCFALAAAVVLGVAAAGASAAATLQGAGSTLIAPLEGEWALAWAATSGNTAPVYQPAGSGKGLSEIGAGQVDFGASDAPLSASTTACPGCFQIPWALSAIGIGWNVPGVQKLNLTGKVLAEIYLGQITNWDSSAITRLNPGEHFPNLAITPLHRTDPSGDSYAFTDYTSSVSGAWSSRVGRGTKPTFPVGPGAQGDSGMVTVMTGTKGSIAYVAVSYLIGHRLGAAGIENAAGRFEVPNLRNISNAAGAVHSMPADREIHIVNPPKSAKIAYPISTFTYAILRSPDPLGNGAELKSFVQYALGPGQSLGERLDFAPLPSKVLAADNAAARHIR